MLPEYKRQRDERRLTKAQERERMAELAREREARTPEHVAPGWLATFWRRLRQ